MRLLRAVSAELDVALAPDYKGGRFHMFDAVVGLSTLHAFLQEARQGAGV